MVATVVEPSTEASDDATQEAHKVVRSAKTTSHRPRCRNDCDFTLTTGARYCPSNTNHA